MSLIVGPHHPFASTDEAINPVVLEEEILIVREPALDRERWSRGRFPRTAWSLAALAFATDHRTEDDLVFRKGSDTFAAPATRCQGDLG